MSRLRQWWRGLGARPPQMVRDLVAREHLSLEIPGRGARPLLRIELQQARQPEADGERLRLRARIQTNLASALRPMLTAAPEGPPPAERGLALRAETRARALVQRGLQIPVLRRAADALLQYDFNTFVDVQASTASLAQGSGALVPSPERLAALGISPDLSAHAPPVQTWAGEAGGGQALISLLRLEPEHWPSGLQAALGGARLSLAVTVVHTAEPARRS